MAKKTKQPLTWKPVIHADDKGTKHEGRYAIDKRLVIVQYEGEEKRAQIGASESGIEALALLLLIELVKSKGRK